MKLASSLVVTGAIVFSVWGIALLQPMPVSANSTQQTHVAQIQESNAPIADTAKPPAPAKKPKPNSTSQGKPLANLNKLVIAGNTAVLPTEQVQQLWQEFNANVSLNSTIVKQPNAVYVLYRDFSANFESATITIGYSVDILSSSKEAVTIAEAKYQPLLVRKKYNSQQIANAWQKIDYRRPINQVVEIHYLSENSAVLSTELLVNYGE